MRQLFRVGICYMVDMTTMQTIYDIPNLGCLLGIAYQSEETRLKELLAERSFDITPAEYLVLRILMTQGQVQQCEISRSLKKDKASVNRSVKSLDKKGYVVVDQRSYKCCMVSLSEAGRRLIPEISGIAETMQGRLESLLTRQQIADLKEILKLIIK